MPIDSQGRWTPDISEKQRELLALCRQKKYILANGPRYSGKSLGALNCLCEHAWRVRSANICIITISQTVGYDSGIWKDLQQILQTWIDGAFGLEWHRKPFIMGNSKKPTLMVRNQFSYDAEGNEIPEERLEEIGGISTVQLESLQNEEEVEDRFKPRRYSMIYVPELTTFHQRKTFNTWTECLRLIGVPEKDQIFLGDGNPPDDESWWMYELWWELLDADEGDIAPEDVPLKRSLARIDINVEDNPYADPHHVALLKAKYRDNDDLYRRYILGECVRTTEDSLFVKVFRPSIHVIGEVATKLNDDPEILVPSQGCIELVTGWDPGASVNSAAVIAAKRTRIEIIKDEKGKEVEHPVPVFDFIDELVITDTPHDLGDFVIQFLLRMKFWEELMGRVGKVMWRHWSDRSVLDMREPVHARFFHQVIYEVSGGIINLMAADRGPGSVGQRVDLWRKLLFDERMYFSAAKCPRLIEMNKSIKKGTNSVQVIQRGSKHKHCFDAASYMVASECYSEINRAVLENLMRPRRNHSSLVSVRV